MAGINSTILHVSLHPFICSYLYQININVNMVMLILAILPSPNQDGGCLVEYGYKLTV